MLRTSLSKSTFSRVKVLFCNQRSQIVIFNELSSQKTPKGSKSAEKAGSPKSSHSNVPGLSSKVLSVPTSAVGPGASKDGEYKNPEYFSYHPISFFEAEVEMSKYRCPQPSAKK